ncbi:MAG: hypothetical protein ACF8R7_09995, partial [Phycisphaerales bacterium JB039]
DFLAFQDEFGAGCLKSPERKLGGLLARRAHGLFLEQRDPELALRALYSGACLRAGRPGMSWQRDPELALRAL